MQKKGLNKQCVFYVFRHAHSTDQAKRFFSGHSDPSLTEQGIRQAEETAKRLSSVHFDAAFSSDLLRAMHTGEVLMRGRNKTLRVSEMIRERSYGKIDGKKPDDSFLQAYEKYFSFSYEERLHMKIVSGMESDYEVITRFLKFLKDTSSKYVGKTVLVVSHGSIMKAFLAHLGFGSHSEMPSGSIENMGYFVLASKGEEFAIKETAGINKTIS